MEAKIKKAKYISLSNAVEPEKTDYIERLSGILAECGTEATPGNNLYIVRESESGYAKERAAELNRLFADESLDAIFDLSGGDIANEVLTYLDYDMIAKQKKRFWGFSDLTTVISAIYTKTGKSSMLYQVGMTEYGTEEQPDNYKSYNLGDGKQLLEYPYKFVRGNKMEGIMVGGNIRCLLKLAGTEYFPDVTNKLLILESSGGSVPKVIAYINQLCQMGVFNKIAGLVVGNFFCTDDDLTRHPTSAELFLRYIPENLPVVKTTWVGHHGGNKGVLIGGYYKYDGDDNMSVEERP